MRRLQLIDSNFDTARTNAARSLAEGAEPGNVVSLGPVIRSTHAVAFKRR